MTLPARRSNHPAIDAPGASVLPWEDGRDPAGQIVQGDWVDNGKPVARRGRNATGLRSDEERQSAGLPKLREASREC
jgi:hypothetical protein